MQVTNRDLSVAVLRKFLPQLAQELRSGTLKRKMKTAPPKQAAAAANGGGPSAPKVSKHQHPFNPFTALLAPCFLADSKSRTWTRCPARPATTCVLHPTTLAYTCHNIPQSALGMCASTSSW